MSDESDDNGFNPDLVRNYPKSNKKIPIDVAPYGLHSESSQETGQSLFISPHGMEFQGTVPYEEGTLLKININLPNYWDRKQRLVDYGRVDHPDNFKILAKVVKSVEVGKRGKKKRVLVRTVNMDQVDEQVLKNFLQDG